MSQLARFIWRMVGRQVVIVSAALAWSALFSATTLFADVEVTLKSGTSLVGTVKIDGNDAIVKIGDSELRVPLTEVDTIAAVDAGPDRQAHRLLTSALEARLTNDSGREVIGLLAEAARLAPDDPHIAYWYASSLSDAGYGQAANDVLEKQREAIAKAYPGMTDQLVERIKRRVEMEKMPPALVERLDKLNADLGKQASSADMRHIAALFRLVDHEKQPIERSAFQIQCNNGQDENLESFDDGYFVYTFNRHRNNDEQPCNLDVTRPGLESKSFELNGSSNRVKDAGELVVRRYDEAAKKPFRIHLVGTDGKPVVGARVSFQGMSPRGNTTSHTLTAESDAEGSAEILAFPMKYTYHVQAGGFNHGSGNVELKADAAETKPIELKLDRAIQATIRVAWEATAMQGGGKTTGEATLQVDGGPPRPYQYGQDNTSWLRPAQQKDRLTLQFVDSPFGYGGPFGQADAWVRVVESDGNANEGERNEGEASAGEPKPLDLDAFNELELSKIDELKSKLKQPRTIGGGQVTGPRPPMVLAAELGKIYVGRVQHRDMRTGQPIQLAFKVFVEEMATDDGAAE
ncbi:MAG: hypothetical protein L0228_07920 [Planctomycetes bacterium]|nr:hypothetical protein [Planctomycetota bacterium]